MKNIISVVMFGTEAKNCNTDEIRSVRTYGNAEEDKFDFKIYDDTTNLYEKLNENRGFDVIVTIGNIEEFPELMAAPFEIRKRWVAYNTLEDFMANAANVILSVFRYNINRANDITPLFSFFTSAYKTQKEDALRLYNSLTAQTYTNWNWWILDDSPEGTESYFNEINDCRITIIKNKTNHGNIGFNKHMIAMCCNGDYLVEVDHDDEVTPDCLEMLKKAFTTYPDCDFAYSYCLEIVDGKPVYYDEGFSLGLGRYIDTTVNGIEYKRVATTPDMNVLSMRHIVSMPNHVRCWKKDFYHRIGGHNIEISIMDDGDLLIRTFLNGKCCKIPKVLYIQNEGVSRKGSRSTTLQSSRAKEIWRMGTILKREYDKKIHDFAIERGLADPYWDKKTGSSDIFKGPLEGLANLNYVLEV